MPRTAPPPGTVLDPDDLFDPEFYAETYPDVIAAGFDPLVHWRGPGRRAGRKPAAWFDPMWYARRFLGATSVEASPDLVAGALEHFAAEGNRARLPPSPNAYKALERDAELLFDEAYYLERYPDVAASPFHPFRHYADVGWQEGRRPSAGFDGDAWRAREMPDAAAGLSPLMHFVATLGLAAASASMATAAAAAAEVPRTPVPTDGGSALLAHVAGRARHPQRPEDDAALVAASPYFDAAAYAAAAKLDPAADALDLARHYLTGGEADGLAPSPQFVPSFYRTTYAELPPRLSALSCPPGASALVHFLRTGRAAGLYPNPIAAFLEVELIRASDLFDPEAYVRAVRRRLRRRDVVADYAIFGHLEGVRGAPAVDDAFVRALYAPLLEVDVRAPLAFYLRYRQRAFMFRSAEELAHHAAAARGSSLFDAAHYAREAGIEPGDPVDPVEHYLTVGLTRGIAPGPEFNVAAYLARYPDLAQVRIEPMQHYERHGRAEGRVAALAALRPAEPGRTPDTSRGLTILFSHEASRTGAPIVALNVARQLSARRDVAVWLGDADGPLLADFARCAVAVRSGWTDPGTMRAEIEALAAGYGDDVVAVVNSVVSHPAIVPLRMAGVPIVSLIHEFADYVIPVGTTALMATFSERAVFPARIVADACEDEMAAIGVASHRGGFRLRHQGQNEAIERDAGAPAADPGPIRTALGLPAVPAADRRDRILLGIGQIQPRKGVDLFLQAALRLVAEDRFDWRFVWVGGGYEPTRDLTTSVYLRQQMRATGLDRRTAFLEPRADLGPLWAAADVFFLSSRLDPFPNVVLDAWKASRPVVCFEGTTGVAEIDAARPFALASVPHSDAAAAADAISAFAADLDAVKAGFSGPAGVALQERLGFPAYVAELETLCAEAQAERARTSQRRAAFERLPRADRQEAMRLVPLPARIMATATLDARAEAEVLAWAEELETAAPSGAVDGLAAYGSEGWRLPQRGHRLHLHIADRGDLTAFVAEPVWIPPTLGWAARLVGHADLVVTSPDAELAATLAQTLGGTATVISDGMEDPVAAIAAVAALPGTERLTVLPLSRIPNLSAGFTIPQEVTDMLAILFSGAADAALDAEPEVTAVIPRRRRDEIGPSLRGHLDTGRQPATRPPRMIGTWRAPDLLRRLGEVGPALDAARLGLDVVGRLELAACLITAGDPPPRYLVGPLVAD
jgi:glycosyltransferase involved in cell wall biosynthesis